MKPLHVGLLVVGAALAGGLAVRMAQPPVIPASAPPNPPPSAVITPAPAAATAAERRIAALNAPEAVSAPAPATPPSVAPPPVYEEPAKPAYRKPKPSQPAPRPVQVAKVKPTQWIPGRYVDPPASAPAPPAAPAPPSPEPPVQASAPPEPLPAPPPERVPALPEPRRVTLRTGTAISVRLNQSLSTDNTLSGDTFQASLAEPLVADGLVIAERGARVTGRVVESQKAGRVSGTSLLELGLTTLETADGQRVSISTDPWSKQGDTSRRADAEKIGGAAALGAIIGAIAGGGKGAAIGAGVGGAAGVGTVAATRGKSANIPSETIIRFRLSSGRTVTEQQLAARQ